MKFALVALVASVSAAGKAVTVAFPDNCDKVAVTSSDPFVACAGSVCCKFKDNQGSALARCMTPAARTSSGGDWSGSYTDDQEGVFKWTCPQPAAAPAAAAAESATALAASVAGVLSLAAMDM